MPVASLDAVVVINGTNVTSHLDEITKTVQLCHPGQGADLSFDATFDASLYLPWHTITITEQGVLVLTGYVEEVITGRPSDRTIVKAKDRYKRALDWFISEELTPNGETVAYWINYLCTLCGLTYILPSVDPYHGANIIIGMELPLGMAFVADSLLTLAALAQWVIRVNPDGVVEFMKLTYPTVADYDFTAMLSGEHTTTDEESRNVAKVWGFDPATFASINVVHRRAVVGLSGDRNMVFAHPGIDSVAEADAIAEAALNQFASLEQRAHVEIIGNPNIRVGQTGRTNIRGNIYLQHITDVASSFNDKGYDQNVITGRRCPRLPGYPAPPQGAVLVVGTNGVYMTTTWGDAPPTWFALNDGSISNPIDQIAVEVVNGAVLYGIGGRRFYRMDDMFGSRLWVPKYTTSSGSPDPNTTRWMVTVASDPGVYGHVSFGLMQTFVPDFDQSQIFYSTDAGETFIGGLILETYQEVALSYNQDGSLILPMASGTRPGPPPTDWLTCFVQALRGVNDVFWSGGATLRTSPPELPRYGIPPSAPPHLARSSGSTSSGSNIAFVYMSGQSMGGNAFHHMRSADNGKTWAVLPDQLYLEGITRNVYSRGQGVAISADGQTWMAVKITTTYPAAPSYTLVKSDTSGSSWTASVTQPPSAPQAVVSVGGDASKWIAFASEAIWYSSDGGATWTEKTGNLLSLMPLVGGFKYIGQVEAVNI